MLGTVLIVILILMLIGAIPWPHSREWVTTEWCLAQYCDCDHSRALGRL